MVSFWPFKGSDTSAASFEKVLASLSTKINKVSTTNDRLKQNQRRIRVLWTLYTGFAYVIAALILILVTGWSNWNAAEYTGLAGGPVVIYGVRLAIDTYFNYRVSGTQSHLNDLYSQRETAIEKLKAATKYNSTQQLLDKYGGTSPKPSPSNEKRKQPGLQGKPTTPQGGRTGIAPPPTANIPGRQAILPPSSPSTPQAFPRQPQSPSQIINSALPSAEFAPNAFSEPTRPTAYAPLEPHPRWYDRILDIVLGEDETQPKNRIVLICQSCRLVNGQAPPGTRSLADMGKWRCSACGALNGKEDEAKRMIREVRQGEEQHAGPEMSEKGTEGKMSAAAGEIVNEIEDGESDDVDSEDGSVDDLDVSATETSPPAASTRSKARQRKKG